MFTSYGMYTLIALCRYFYTGALVQAMRNGHWVILDELNLAPSDVLEALNRVCILPIIAMLC